MHMGMNLGLTKMAESCPYTYRQLSWSVDWHIREETLLAALASLDNFVLNSPLGWEYTSLTGNYHFAPQTERDLSHLRPLRVPEEGVSSPGTPTPAK